MKNKILVWGFALVILSAIFSVNLAISNNSLNTVYLMSPANNSWNSGNNNTIQFTSNHTGALTGNVNCSLRIDNIDSGTNVSSPANTVLIIYANHSLSDGAIQWLVNCTNGTATEQSQTWILNIDTGIPSLTFQSPTPANNTYIPRNSTEVNITITELNLDRFIFSWNNTNYSFYDSSLVLAMNFNNNSAIGEGGNRTVDISKYGNNGTCYGVGGQVCNWTTSGRFGGALQFDGVDHETSLQMT